MSGTHRSPFDFPVVEFVLQPQTIQGVWICPYSCPNGKEGVILPVHLLKAPLPPPPPPPPPPPQGTGAPRINAAFAQLLCTLTSTDNMLLAEQCVHQHISATLVPCRICEERKLPLQRH